MYVSPGNTVHLLREAQMKNKRGKGKALVCNVEHMDGRIKGKSSLSHKIGDVPVQGHLVYSPEDALAGKRQLGEAFGQKSFIASDIPDDE